MANEAQEKLFEIFVKLAGEQVSTLSAMVDTSQQLAGSLGEVVKQINVTKAGAVQSSTSTSKTGDPSGGPLSVVEGIASTVIHNALGAVPVIRGILSLFGGGDDKPPEPSLVKYVLPPSIHFQAAETESGFTAVDFDQSGLARSFDGAGETRPEMPGPRQNTQANMPVPSGGQQITVHVDAMDARSFLDRSSDIAAAVRNAMLNLNSINDVMNDL